MSDTKTHTGLTAVMPPLGATGPKGRWRKATLTTLHAAEELLDQLESAGYGERRLSVVDDVFVVRWR
jgi:hypothetical protein